MQDDILKGKKILIVDDEPDILETLEELLDMCLIDTAPDFESAEKFLEKNRYDVAIFDIMGVRGYDLLQIASQKGVAVLILTANALSPDNLIKSIKEGAQSYVPKDKISDIHLYLEDILKAHQKGVEKQGNWFARLTPFFDKKFGADWMEKDKEFWKDFNQEYIISKEELEKMI